MCYFRFCSGAHQLLGIESEGSVGGVLLRKVTEEFGDWVLPPEGLRDTAVGKEELEGLEGKQ